MKKGGIAIMRIGIVGYGVVGKHLAKVFSSGQSELFIYDKYLPEYASADHKQNINRCDLVFIAVPTPSLEDGNCDLSAIEESVEWIQPPICIKSTIVPGTTDRLVAYTGKQIVFSPEYVGETPFHAYRSRALDFIAIGGEPTTCSLFASAYRTVLGPEPIYFLTDSITAELAKYMENCFLATKVAFVAQFYLLAQHFGADFNQLREIWVADARIGRSHSTVVDRLGFGGRCLPKDLAAIICTARQAGIEAPLLEAVQQFNRDVRNS